MQPAGDVRARWQRLPVSVWGWLRGYHPCAPSEGRTRRALVLPSRTHLRACGAGNGPRLRVMAAGVCAPSSAACHLPLVARRGRACGRGGDGGIACPSLPLESDARGEKNSYKVQASSDKPERACRVESCSLELVAPDSHRPEAAACVDPAHHWRERPRPSLTDIGARPTRKAAAHCRAQPARPDRGLSCSMSARKTGSLPI
jgi:hypothetical protein